MSGAEPKRNAADHGKETGKDRHTGDHGVAREHAPGRKHDHRTEPGHDTTHDERPAGERTVGTLLSETAKRQCCTQFRAGDWNRTR
jgi:hypothetical protein